MNENELIELIDMCLPINFKVFEGDNDKSIIVKERESGKEFLIRVEENIE